MTNSGDIRSAQRAAVTAQHEASFLALVDVARAGLPVRGGKTKEWTQQQEKERD